MATTTRSTRSKTAKPEDSTEAEAPSTAGNEQPQDEIAAPSLDTAPLEPPAPRPAPEPDTPDSTQVWALPAELTDWVVDAHTNATPDPDTLFTKVFEFGNVEECQARLLEHVRIPPYGNQVTRLLLPQGAHVTLVEAERIRARIRQQLETQPGQ